MLATLVLIVCTAMQPQICREDRPPVAITAQACAIHGQLYAQAHERDHPGTVVPRWRCELGERA